MASSASSFTKDANRYPIEALAQVGANSTVLVQPSGSSTQSTAITANIVRIAVTAAMNLEFGTNPTATSNSLYMPANSVEYFQFVSGQLIAFLGTGNCYITPMA